jgi:hypothetical protein
MVDPQVPLRVTSANIHSKAFDDEVVVLDMTSGTYFSLRGGAAEIWALVQSQATTADIITTLTDRYDTPPEVTAALARQCVSELLEAGLVITDPSLSRLAPAERALGAVTRPFPAPEIERFTDMQELLLLDPIHEVDDTGWPNASPRTSPRT